MDINIFFFLNNLAGQSWIFDWLTIFLAEYFQYFLVLLFLVIVYFSREKFYMFWVTVISAVVARFGVTSLIRLFYHRPRPFTVYSVHKLITENDYSFPSGHSSFFFAMAAAIYFYNKKWGIVFFVAALFMNISRIIAGVHYPSDILGGVVVGVVTAYAVNYIVRYWNRNKLIV